MIHVFELVFGKHIRKTQTKNDYRVQSIMPTYPTTERMQYLFTNQNPYTLQDKI